MFNEDNLTTDFFKNPMMIQRKVLEEHQNRLNGEYAIADPNNSFMYLLEASSQMTADSMRLLEKSLASIYPNRATSMEELYGHMSDFVSVAINNTPAELSEFSIIFDKEYLIENAVKYDENYNKITIPKDTVISIGKYKMSLYYPIDILINRRTNSINVTYDTSSDNPLKVLNYNVVDTRQYQFQSLKVLDITFPIYQFIKKTYNEEIILAQGFNKYYDYEDKYYAIRVFDRTNNTELRVTYSNNIYDYFVPTAVVSVIPERQKLLVHIPQMYLYQNMVGTDIEIEIYTTRGKLSVDISEIDETEININFGLDRKSTTTYSSILNTIPTMILRPISNRIEGGSDSLSFEEIRSGIVNDTLYKQVPITQLALEKYFNDEGFSVKKIKDNITDRTLVAYRPLKNTKDKMLPTIFTDIKLTKENIVDISSIKLQTDESITILPTTIYEYNPNTDICKPISDIEKEELLSLDKLSFCDKLNRYYYTKSPFHMTIFTRDRYPELRVFDLNNPTLTDLTFIKDNPTTSIQMVIAACTIRHLDEGSGGYLIRLGMTKSDELKSVLEEKILVSLIGKTYMGTTVTMSATYQGELSGLSIYDLYLDTNYHIEDANIGIDGFVTNSDIAITQYFNLQSYFEIVVAIDKDVVKDNPYITDDQKITKDLNPRYSNYIGVTKQKVLCTFGSELTDNLHTNVNINMSNVDYLRYTTDIIRTHQKDVYETNPDGSLKILDVVDGKIILNKLHSAGDPVYKDGQPDIIYPSGSIVHDENGEAVIDQESTHIYYIRSLHINLKLFYVEDPIYKNFNEQITNTIRTHLAKIAEIKKDVLLERTSLYFEPIKTMGLGSFSLGDNKRIDMKLDLSFKFSFYVPDYVYVDNTILDMINSNLTKETISVTNISEEIKSTLGDYIYSMDVGGINDDILLQTLIVNDKATKPIIRNKLVYENNILNLIEDVDIKFIKAT
jgi:hypothetical protein